MIRDCKSLVVFFPEIGLPKVDGLYPKIPPWFEMNGGMIPVWGNLGNLQIGTYPICKQAITGYNRQLNGMKILPNRPNALKWEEIQLAMPKITWGYKFWVSVGQMVCQKVRRMLALSRNYIDVSENWLVVWNIFYFPICWVANHPNWLSYFSEG